MDLNQLPAVAKKVYTNCKKCDCDRYHVVVAHTSANTARLECEVCKSKSSLKIEETRRLKTAAPKKKITTKSKSKAAANASLKWNDLRERASEKPTPYTMKSAFEVGASVEHPKFGLGFVILATGQAIQVVFEDGERALVHNRT